MNEHEVRAIVRRIFVELGVDRRTVDEMSETILVDEGRVRDGRVLVAPGPEQSNDWFGSWCDQPRFGVSLIRLWKPFCTW